MSGRREMPFVVGSVIPAAGGQVLRGASMEEMANITIQRQPFKPNPEMQALIDRVTSRVQEDFEQQVAEEIGQLFRTGRSITRMNTTTSSNMQEQSEALTRERLEEAIRLVTGPGDRMITPPVYFQGAPIFWDDDSPVEDFGEGAPIEAVGYYEGVDGGMTVEEIIEKWKKKGDQHADTWSTWRLFVLDVDPVRLVSSTERIDRSASCVCFSARDAPALHDGSDAADEPELPPRLYSQ